MLWFDGNGVVHFEKSSTGVADDDNSSNDYDDCNSNSDDAIDFKKGRRVLLGMM